MDSKSKSKINTSRKNNVFASALYGIITGVAVTLIISLIISALALKLKNPVNYTKIMSAICISIGGLCCGIVSSATNKSRNIISSVCALAILSMIILISFICNNSWDIISLINPALLFASGMLGAYIINSQKSKSKIKKYMK